MSLRAAPSSFTPVRRGARVARLVAALVAANITLALVAPAAIAAPGKATQRVIVMTRNGAKGKANVVKVMKNQGGRGVATFRLINGVSGLVSATTVRWLKSSRDVVAVVPERRRALIKPPGIGEGDTPQSQPGTSGTSASNPNRHEAIELMDVDGAWSLGASGAGVRVAFIDSGIDTTHPDLRGAMATDAAGRAQYRDFTQTGLTDDVGHGTAVAGQVVSQGKQVYSPQQTFGPYIRMEGVAPGAKAMAGKVFDKNAVGEGGWDSWIIRAIEWAVDPDGNPGTRDGADVISMSLGGPTFPQLGLDPLNQAVTAASARGVAVFIAAGNSGPGAGSIESPGITDAAITVGATTQLRQFAETFFQTSGDKFKSDSVIVWSSRSPTADGRFKPEIMAPGAFGWSLAPVNSSLGGKVIASFGGTSQATPLAAGVAALVIESYRATHGGTSPTPAMIKDILAGSADDLNLPSFVQSAGRVNAARAVRLARGMPGFKVDDPRFSAAPGATSKSFQVHNYGPGTATYSVSPVTYETLHARTIHDTMPAWTDAKRQARPSRYLRIDDLPAGTEAVRARIIWEDDADRTAIRFNMYDRYEDGPGPVSESVRPTVIGDLVNYGPVFGPPVPASYGEAYGRMMTGDPRPGHEPGDDWLLQVYPRNFGQAPRAPLPYTVRVDAIRKVAGPPADTCAAASGGSCALLVNTVLPAQAGTSFAQYEVTATNTDQTTTIPVVKQSPVMPNVPFTAVLSGSTDTFGGGENHHFRFDVPAGTGNLVLTLDWENTGHIVYPVLIDPAGRVRVAKQNNFNGNQAGVSDPKPLVDLDGNETTEAQIVVDSPEAGTWRFEVTAPGFAGTGFTEEVAGMLRFNQAVASESPITINLTGGSGSAVVNVANPGNSDMLVLTRGRTSASGTHVLFRGGGLLSGNHTPIFGSFAAPPDTDSLTVTASWNKPEQPVDVSLFDAFIATAINVQGTGGSMTGTFDPPGAVMPGGWGIAVAYGGSPPTPSIQVGAVLTGFGPMPYEPLSAGPLRVDAGQTRALTIAVSGASPGATGTILLWTAEGDILARIPFSTA